MAEKVLFTRSVDLVPLRKGVYKDPMKDFKGFALYVTPEVPVDENDVTKGKRPCKQRHWGEDPEYDRVMCNFGMTPGPDGSDIEQQLVFGWANVSVQEDGSAPFDWQGDVIPTEELECAAYNFVLKHGVVDQEHMWDTECGWLVESMVFTKDKMAALGIPTGLIPEGWFVGFYIPDPAVYAKVKDGTYNMFSIEGSGQRIPLDGAKMV